MKQRDPLMETSMKLVRNDQTLSSYYQGLHSTQCVTCEHNALLVNTMRYL